LVYVQNLPETRGREREFSLASTGKGEGLFKEKGCAGCHQGKLALEKLLTTGTVTDFAVAMWNHAPAMAAEAKKSGKPLPKLEPLEMQELVSYLWDSVLFSEQGNAARGERAFAKKNCTACHGEKSSGAPDLKQWLSQRGDPIRPFSIMSVLWQHGPAMLQGMKAKNVAWPNFSQNEMLDMIAYLNSLGSKQGARGANLFGAEAHAGEPVGQEHFFAADGAAGAVVIALAIEQAAVPMPAVAVAVARLLGEDGGDAFGDFVDVGQFGISEHGGGERLG
jgi:mono/diheme cytochrome c family protein